MGALPNLNLHLAVVYLCFLQSSSPGVEREPAFLQQHKGLAAYVTAQGALRGVREISHGIFSAELFQKSFPSKFLCLWRVCIGTPWCFIPPSRKKMCRKLKVQRFSGMCGYSKGTGLRWQERTGNRVALLLFCPDLSCSSFSRETPHPDLLPCSEPAIK